ncbi:MAG: exodeoxyribonuclease VII large subunit [Pseudomonadota bacterium]
MELFDEVSNAPEFTVSELSGAVKRTVEGAFQHVRVRGEVGRVSRPRSGHVYLDLKDDRAVLASVIWKGAAARLEVQPEEGMEVIATGRLTTFPGQSRYQIVIEALAPAGLGALMAMLERRKAALAAEGLFAAERKRALPYIPETIGVVTSPSGAVIRDILHRLHDRFPRPVLLWPVPVQGQGSAEKVAAAIAGFGSLPPGGAVPRPDVLIVARGGGSVEDLWGFNEEVVVRAVAACPIPVISAVGHETDTTLIDLVADRRAPTPSAAAEMAVPVRAELLAALAALEARRVRGMVTRHAASAQRLRDVARALPRPAALLSERAQRFDGVAPRLVRALAAVAATRRLRLASGPGGRFAPGLFLAAAAQRREAVSARAARLTRGAGRGIERAGDRVAGLRLPVSSLLARRDEAERALRALTARLRAAGPARLLASRTALQSLDRVHETLGYRQTLARGFAVVRDGHGRILADRAEAGSAATLEIEFRDGRLVTGGRKRGRATVDDDGQGSLF